MKCEPVDSNASGRIVCKIEEKRTVTRPSSELQFTKRRKMHEARDYSPCGGVSVSVRSEVGPNLKSREHSHVANLQFISSSASVRSELKPVKPLATSSRVHKSKSKKTAYLANFTSSSSIKRPKVYPQHDFPSHCGNLASEISGVGAEESTNHSYTTCSAVAIPRKPLRGLDAEIVESLNSWSRGYEHVKNKSANHEMPLEVIWKKEKGMSSMSGYPTQSEDHDFVQASEPKYGQTANEEVNAIIVPHDVNQTARNKVKAVLKEFEKLYTELHRAASKTEGKSLQRVDVRAAECLRREGKWIWSEKQLGDIQGVAVGDHFQFRAELVVIGLHCQYVSGIDYLLLNGRNYATSIVDSGHYENMDKSVDVFIYTGQGGNPVFGDNKSDQELKKGNLALENSMREGYPVRVIRKRKSPGASTLLHMKGERVLAISYEYCGLYRVERCGQEREGGRLVFKFELHRIMGQPVLPLQNAKGSKRCQERCVIEDISLGKEKIAVRVMNGIDEGKPQSFSYITNITYPDWCKREEPGCNCIEGCSNSGQCLCVKLNDGGISFSERSINHAHKDVVYECGPSCTCPLSCGNRVSQNGPRYKLEIFRTTLQRWGVRSRSFISSGSFVCEYIGNLLQIKNARPKSEQDQVGFMYAGSENQFIVDPSKFGNVGRFITHNNSPNLVARYVLFDHNDKRMPHIMLFAAKSIPPMQEFTCNYNQC